jgi:drug/metabolite transporter (DMT)-like permease
MKTLNLFMAILMALVTTCIILLFFFSFEESDFGWGFITLVSILGYLASAWYFYKYKHNTKKKLASW